MFFFLGHELEFVPSFTKNGQMYCPHHVFWMYTKKFEILGRPHISDLSICEGV